MAEQAQPTQAAPTGKRGVSYPGIPLEDAVKFARKLWEREKKNAAPFASAAAAWGYSEKSSGVRTAVAALLGFGLINNAGSTGDSRMIQLSDRAIDIALDSPETPQRLQEAVRLPKIYADLLGKWPAHELPSDTTLRIYLIKEKDFNPTSVDRFIQDFRASIRYAKLDNASKLPENNPNGVKIGDYIQWESGGVLKLPQPQQVTGISEDEKFAFVEGSATGLPLGELTVTEKPAGVPPVKPQMPNIFQGTDMRQDTFSLDEGQVVLQWPSGMSDDSFNDFEAWVTLQVKKIKRSTKPQ